MPDLKKYRAIADDQQAPIFIKSVTSKRPFSAIESLSDSDNSDSSDEDSDDAPVTEHCDAIRRKINKLINSGAIKVTEFQRACNVNSNSYERFMFFERRKRAGIKEPAKKKVEKD